MTLAISVFGEETDRGIALVGEITSVIAVERPDVWFDVSQAPADSIKEETFESARPIHRLRGFGLYCERHGRAATAEEAEAGYPLLEELYDGKCVSSWYPHLVEHADDDGFYIPADFAVPINAFLDGEVMSIGSSHRLLAEMNSIGKYMGEIADDVEVFAPEKRMWSVLHAMADISVKNNLIIRFRISNPDFD